MASRDNDGSSSSGKQPQPQPLGRQNSMYGLTLDEVQNHLGDLGKPLGSLNLDELLKSIWAAEDDQSMNMDIESTTVGSQFPFQRQGSLSLPDPLSKKTVEEVWRDIQHINAADLEEKTVKERQPTLGEMTLEDFLVKAGVVAEGMLGKELAGAVASGDLGTAVQFSQPRQWIPYQQPSFLAPQLNMTSVCVSAQQIPLPPMPMDVGSVMDVSYAKSQMPFPSTLTGALSDSQMFARKRMPPDDVMEKAVERRQKRMIKNRESAARSRAKKQAYTNELESKVSRLEVENERLRKEQELEKMLPSESSPDVRYQLRRTSSSPL